MELLSRIRVYGIEAQRSVRRSLHFHTELRKIPVSQTTGDAAMLMPRDGAGGSNVGK